MTSKSLRIVGLFNACLTLIGGLFNACLTLIGGLFLWTNFFINELLIEAY